MIEIDPLRYPSIRPVAGLRTGFDGSDRSDGPGHVRYGRGGQATNGSVRRALDPFREEIQRRNSLPRRSGVREEAKRDAGDEETEPDTAREWLRKQGEDETDGDDSRQKARHTPSTAAVRTNTVLVHFAHWSACSSSSFVRTNTVLVHSFAGDRSFRDGTWVSNCAVSRMLSVASNSSAARRTVASGSISTP